MDSEQKIDWRILRLSNNISGQRRSIRQLTASPYVMMWLCMDRRFWLVVTRLSRSTKFLRIGPV